jgi:hypothetical protein
MLSFFTVSNCYHFYVIIFTCTYFVFSFMLSFLGRYHLMLQFFTVSKCYHFYVIFPCTYFVLSFMLSFIVIMTFTVHHEMKNDNILYNQKYNFKEFKNDNIYTIKMITSNPSKMITFTPWKMITSSTLENDNIQAFKSDNIHTMKYDNSLYTRKLKHPGLKKW